MKITFHGAAREVGRSGVLIEEGNKRILCDYGIKIGEKRNELPLPVKGHLDAIICSHAHLDHCGEIPALYQKSEQPMYTTPASMPLIQLLVQDSLKVNRLKGIRNNFSPQHVKRMMRSTIPVPYSKERSIYDISLKFEDAGHILGAASTEIIMNDKKVVYTGDVKYEETRLHAPGFQKFKDVDVLVIEGTYGNREHEPRENVERDFVEACNNICDNKGNVMVPAFAVGRTQEIISILNENNFKYPIFMDGMSKAAAEIMMDFPDYLKDYNSFYKAMKKAEWVYSNKQRERALAEPSVIVSTAGMLSGGPAMSYILRMKELEKKAIFFSGYQVQGTPGRILLETGRMEYEDYNLNFDDYEIKKFDFSAHTDHNGLLNLVKKVKPKLTIVNHSDEEAALQLGKDFDELGFETKVPKFAETINVERYL